MIFVLVKEVEGNFPISWARFLLLLCSKGQTWSRHWVLAITYCQWSMLGEEDRNKNCLQPVQGLFCPSVLSPGKGKTSLFLGVPFTVWNCGISARICRVSKRCKLKSEEFVLVFPAQEFANEKLLLSWSWNWLEI